jgi:hypothetical protein
VDNWLDNLYGAVYITDMENIQTLIDQTTTKILTDWTEEARAAGIDADDYIGDKLDAMEETEPEVRMAVGRMYLRMVMKVA